MSTDPVLPGALKLTTPHAKVSKHGATSVLSSFTLPSCSDLIVQKLK